MLHLGVEEERKFVASEIISEYNTWVLINVYFFKVSITKNSLKSCEQLKRNSTDTKQLIKQRGS